MTRTQNHPIMLHTTGDKINGTIYIGFITNGKPKIIGSLILNKPGASDILQIWYCALFFLPTINVAIIKPKVAPEPPVLPKASLIDPQLIG